MSNAESDALRALDLLFLQGGMSGVNKVIEQFEARVKARFPNEVVKVKSKVPGSGTGVVPLATTISPPCTAPRLLAPGNANPRSQNSRGHGTNKPGPRALGDQPKGEGVHPSPHTTCTSPHSSTTISVGDDDSDSDEPRRARLSPISVPPLPFIFIPPPSGNGGHIFTTRNSNLPTPSRDVPEDAAEEEYPDFVDYKKFLQFRGPHDAENVQIYHPLGDDIGDNDGWYYVTIGRRVGVFNSWAQVKHSTSGIDGAAWKRVESKDIAYRVLTSTLKQRAVVVVNS